MSPSERAVACDDLAAQAAEANLGDSDLHDTLEPDTQRIYGDAYQWHLHDGPSLPVSLSKFSIIELY
jgi:hypothetical protein